MITVTPLAPNNNDVGYCMNEKGTRAIDHDDEAEIEHTRTEHSGYNHGGPAQKQKSSTAFGDDLEMKETNENPGGQK